MPNIADNSEHIVFPLPEVPPAISVPNALPDHLFTQVKSRLQGLGWGPGSDTRYHSIASRWTLNVHFTEEIDAAFLKLARENFQDPDIELSFYYTCRYQINEGNIPYLWTHMDQNGCQHTMDMCVIKENLDDWGLLVDGELFSEQENSAIFMSSCQQAHGRPAFPSRDPEAYIVVLFAIYTKPDHWWRDLDGTQESFETAIDQYRWDGDIRYAEHAGNAPYFDNIPAENKDCRAYGEVECHECWTIPEDVLEAKKVRNKEINSK